MNERIPRIAVTPPAFCNSPSLIAELSSHFPNTVFNEKDRYLSGSELVSFLADADAALIGRDSIDAELIRSLPNLKMISKYGVGLDNLDQDAMRQASIELRVTPGTNRRSVAELTLGFMIGLCHNIFSGSEELKSGSWRRDGGQELTGKTVGIIGCGNVGQELVRLLQPFQCRIMVRDIADRNKFCRQMGAVTATFDEVIEEADIVTLHVPLTEKTENFIYKPVFAKMKSSAFLVNTSRGRVVHQGDLHQALTSGELAAAALDVFAEEPPTDIDFLQLPNLWVTPHIGGNAREAVEAMGRAAIQNLVEYFNIKK
ncbi:MAG: phosphoglycerate dehydrogenase [Nitrospina sp.]|jgi:phosphoglycerate dehydrogenase-like enzyme|nr:phosphoglycerate dehydrogenase [Nitrospina sp.]MBT3509798.1 phosphoglycerate dehydrogenase [Nitrospina sp.]MBT3874897.1 phosphoglycerate dehydrogenase [Nitrospina sp.]MBT4049796.1 phosphoglycerate dehydrogenase [Nitrospina sp.]MBT4558722.1 phosphoglycerate dehydrogenase [Nitrospina sp.]